MGIDGADIKRTKEGGGQNSQTNTEPKTPAPQQPFRSNRSITIEIPLRKAWIAAVVAFTLAAVGYIWIGPTLTLNGIIKSANEQDTERLRELVDFPALRENLKGQIDAQVSQHLTEELKDNPFAAVFSGMANLMTDKVVDSLITPDGLLNLSRFDTDKERKRTGVIDLLGRTECTFHSISRATITKNDPADEDLRLVFARNGLSWKLVNIRVPDPKRVFSSE